MSECKDESENFDWDCKTCLYEVLGVSRDASTREIIKTYRKLSLKIHPDKHKERKEHWESLFKILQEAYDTLKDSKSREKYDNDMPLTSSRAKRKSSARTVPKPKKRLPWASSLSNLLLVMSSNIVPSSTKHTMDGILTLEMCLAKSRKSKGQR